MSRFKRSEATNALIRFLVMHDKGSQATYDELSRVADRPIMSKSGHLSVARRALEREFNQVWACIPPNIGLVRLNDAEIAQRQREWYLLGARNKLKAGAQQAEVVDLDMLSADQQARFATDSIVRELGREALSRVTQRRIEKVARGSSNDLPAFNAVEWMISLSPRRSRGAT
jgi:hypothetical protein